MVGKPFSKPFFLKKNTLIESVYCQHVKLTVTRSNFMISAVATMHTKQNCSNEADV